MPALAAVASPVMAAPNSPGACATATQYTLLTP